MESEPRKRERERERKGDGEEKEKRREVRVVAGVHETHNSHPAEPSVVKTTMPTRIPSVVKTTGREMRGHHPEGATACRNQCGAGNIVVKAQ
jgi:hypothetical protein